MALVTTIAEIKAVLPRLVSNLTDTALLPNFARAEEKYLIPLTGRALYNDIVTKKAASSLSPDEQLLLLQMQLVISAYAFYDELGMIHATISSSGVRRLNTANAPAAYQWEYQGLKTALQEAAVDGIEVLLSTLTAQAPALWTSSAEYTEFKKLLIKTGMQFNEIERLQQPLRTFWMMKTAIADAQQHYISNTIGPDLLEYLRDKTSPTDEEISILRWLRKALANFAIKHAIAKYSGFFDTNGFTVVAASDTSETAGKRFDTSIIDLKIREHETNGNAYLAKAANECYVYYDNAVAGFKTAYDAGPLASYAAPADRDSGNSTRKIFRM